MNCIGLYRARTFGRPKDILAASEGMSNLLGAKMGAPLIFDLPSVNFDLALPWEAKGGITRPYQETRKMRRNLTASNSPAGLGAAGWDLAWFTTARQ
jgi:hypothetical protein